MFNPLGEIERLEWAGVGYFPLPRSVKLRYNRTWLGSGKIVFLEGRPLIRRTECSGHISKWLLFLSCCWKQEGIFHGSSQWEHVGALRGKTHKSMRNPLILGFREFLSFKLVHSQSAVFSQVFFNCSHQMLAPVAFSAQCMVIVCFYLTLQFWGWWFYLVNSSDVSKKSC